MPDVAAPLMSKGHAVASKPAKPFEIVQAWPRGKWLCGRIGHGAFHDRPSPGWPLQCPDPETRNGTNDALAAICSSAAIERHGAWVLLATATALSETAEIPSSSIPICPGPAAAFLNRYFP